MTGFPQVCLHAGAARSSTSSWVSIDSCPHNTASMSPALEQLKPTMWTRIQALVTTPSLTSADRFIPAYNSLMESKLVSSGPDILLMFQKGLSPSLQHRDKFIGSRAVQNSTQLPLQCAIFRAMLKQYVQSSFFSVSFSGISVLGYFVCFFTVFYYYLFDHSICSASDIVSA